MVVLAPRISDLKSAIEEFGEALKSLSVSKIDDTTFLVKNSKKGTEHRVSISVIPSEAIELPEDAFDAECDCEDFKFRRRTQRKPCKHIYAVLKDYFDNKIEISRMHKAKEEVKDEKETETKISEAKPEMKCEMSKIEKVSLNNVIPRELQQVQVQEVKEEIAKEEEIAKTIDELDEKIMMREWIVGQTPLVYRVMIRDQPRFLLSIRGWIEAALLQKNIVVESIEFFTVKDKLVAIAWAKDTARNVRVFGIAERASPREEFKLTTLAHKALRNALKNLVSPEFERKVIQMAQNARAILDLRGFGIVGGEKDGE